MSRAGHLVCTMFMQAASLIQLHFRIAKRFQILQKLWKPAFLQLLSHLLPGILNFNLMNNLKLYISILALVALFYSCTKVINIKTGNDSGELDIEANVVDTTGLQTITLSRNVPFTNTNVYPTVSGAKITVTDPSGNSYSFAEGPLGTYTNPQLTGVSGNAYKMTVVIGGTTYNATSTMPAKVGFRFGYLPKRTAFNRH